MIDILSCAVGLFTGLTELTDLIVIADVPDNESMAAIALALVAGGAIKSSRTTALMTGAEGVNAL